MSEKTFELPDVGEGLVEAEIVEWKVAVCAKYASGLSEWCSIAPMPPWNGRRITRPIV